MLRLGRIWKPGFASLGFFYFLNFFFFAGGGGEQSMMDQEYAGSMGGHSLAHAMFCRRGAGRGRGDGERRISKGASHIKRYLRQTPPPPRVWTLVLHLPGLITTAVFLDDTVGDSICCVNW